MVLPLNPQLAATARPPVMEAARWLRDTPLPEGLPLLNVSQAAPAAPPPAPLREAIAEIALTVPQAHLYGPDLGLPDLRDALAAEIAGHYDGAVSGNQIAITSGCNQAFCAAIATLAGPGDEVILPTPWYFNHKMWLDISDVRTVALPTDDALLPDPGHAASLITERTRAIVLVTPNNPGGAEYPAEIMRAFYELAQAQGIALIVDETYRDFHAQSGAPHDLFTDPDWPETLIHLYSFSKSYRLTGHRVGALASSERRLQEIEKFIDTVTICANQIGQRAALWGMQNLGQWLAGERAEILDRRAAIAEGAPGLDGWHLKGLGAYFAWLEHPFDMPSDRLAQKLLREQAILALPGTMFMPEGQGRQGLRIAFANIDRTQIGQLFERLAALTP